MGKKVLIFLPFIVRLIYQIYFSRGSYVEPFEHEFFDSRGPKKLGEGKNPFFYFRSPR